MTAPGWVPIVGLTAEQRLALTAHHRDAIAFAQARIDAISNLLPDEGIALEFDEADVLGLARFGL